MNVRNPHEGHNIMGNIWLSLRILCSTDLLGPLGEGSLDSGDAVGIGLAVIDPHRFVVKRKALRGERRGGRGERRGGR